MELQQYLENLSSPVTLQSIYKETKGKLDQTKLVLELEEAEERGEVEILRLQPRGQDGAHLICVYLGQRLDGQRTITTARESARIRVGKSSCCTKRENLPFRSPVVNSSLSAAATISPLKNSPTNFSSPCRKPIPTPARTVRRPPKLHSTKITLASVKKLKQELKDVERDICSLGAEYCEEELQSHIDKLHMYNEVKDVGQILLGKLAEVEGVTTTQLYQRFGLELED